MVFRDEERGCAGSHARVASGAQLPGVFIEVHHEQGPTLQRAGLPVGVVTAIVGYARGMRTVHGRAGHAGTTPMDVREDALVTAALELLRIRAVACGIEGAVVTVGQVSVEPGGTNVIPGRVRFSIDARAPDSERLEQLIGDIGAFENLQLVEPSPMSPRVRIQLPHGIP